MDVINTEIQISPVPELLDTREKVATLRESLIAATEEAFQRLDTAKGKSWQESHGIVLD